jgi:hypothetical protein
MLSVYVFLYHILELMSRYSDGLWTGRPGFDSRQGQYFSLVYSVQTRSGAHKASYLMGTTGSLPG